MDDRKTKPKKVAILGGGMGALTTAFELSRQPGWKDRFDITIYQMGHRLGGKCASSRGLHDRIEEHGIHGFMGSYFNTLPMMAELYQELARAKGDPLATFEDAFIGSNFSMMWEWIDSTLKPWPFRMEPNAGLPTDAACYKGLRSSVESILANAQAKFSKLPAAAVQGGPMGQVIQIFAAAADELKSDGPLGPAHPLKATFEGLRKGLADYAVASKQAGTLDDDTRRICLELDFLATMVIGAMAENVDVEGYDKLDDQDWADWLRQQGIQADTLRSPIAVTTVNICYQSADGDTTRAPIMAAGAYLNWTLKSFAYVGNMLYSFGAGTGETIIAPMYEVLRRRGVKFEFFQKVEALHMSRSEPPTIETVEITVQATLKTPATAYDPLVKVGDPALPSWPKDPLYDQLEQGDELKTRAIDLESWWNGWPSDAHAKLKTPRFLKRGQDFDEVVYAIGPCAAKHICAELIDARPEWRAMVGMLKGVQTQAMQIWLTADYEGLGWQEPMDLARNETPCSATYVGPQNGNEEFSRLLSLEHWPANNKPLALWYFCGLMPNYEDAPSFSDTDYPARQRDRVKAQCIQYLQASIGPMLKNATTLATQGYGDAVGFNFDLLWNNEDETGASGKSANPVAGVRRFDMQYWRANIDPSELYVTSPPRSTDYRLEAWGSGFANLTLAGDWIHTGINVGSFEGATMSGKLASYALSQAPALETVIGYPLHARPVMPGGRAHVEPPWLTEDQRAARRQAAAQVPAPPPAAPQPAAPALAPVLEPQ